MAVQRIVVRHDRIQGVCAYHWSDTRGLQAADPARTRRAFGIFGRVAVDVMRLAYGKRI